MNRIIKTNIPIDVIEFNAMQACFDALFLDYTLTFDSKMEKYINTNNAFFECYDERERLMVSIVKACNALHRLIINFRLANGGDL